MELFHRIWFPLFLMVLKSAFASEFGAHFRQPEEEVEYFLETTPEAKEENASFHKSIESDKIRLRFHAFHRKFHLELTAETNHNAEMDTKPTAQKHNLSDFGSIRERHYFGKARGTEESRIAVNLCNGSVISGIVRDVSGIYTLRPGSVPGRLTVSRESKIISSDAHCGYNSGNDVRILSDKMRVKRSVKPPSNTTSESYFVELVLVADFSMYEKYDRDEHKLTQRLIEMTNAANALFNSLNIFVALVGVEIWKNGDKINITRDSEAVMRSFLKYRKESLLSWLPNDAAFFVTNVKFDGNVAGKAYRGVLCSSESSGGIARDHSQSASIVGATIAHELGHTFGMEHDYTNCGCVGNMDNCVMTPHSMNDMPVSWSICSINYLHDSLSQGIGTCLKNVPKRVTGPSCGNGFLEDGEDCDCGPEEYCKNKCCVATTCRLSVNATCGHGSCCDLDTCSLRPAATVCRDPSSECDLPEYCDGEKGTCPDDTWAADGRSCKGGQAYCYLGTCKTPEDQCKTIWGRTGSLASEKCFGLNVKGDYRGHCGLNRLNNSHTACSVDDVKCGLLHCNAQTDNYIGAQGPRSNYDSNIPSGRTFINCRSVSVDFGMDVPDVGMVPSGAKCGEDKICYKSRCVSPESLPVRCSDDCRGAGVCNNLGNCHCDVGYNPPYCHGAGPGGSIDSGPASDPKYYTRLRDALLVIFLLIVPVAIGGFLIFAFRFRIRNWLTMKRKMGRSAKLSAAGQDAVKFQKNNSSSNSGSGSTKSKKQRSVRGVPISHPVQTEITVHNGGTAHTTSVTDAWPRSDVAETWPVARGGPSVTLYENVPPPPLPSKPPKAVKDLEITSASSSDELLERDPHYMNNNTEDTVRPVRPAPPPPQSRPTVSRSSSHSSSKSNRILRPNERPPEPPQTGRTADGNGRLGPSASGSGPRRSPTSGQNSDVGKSPLVAELARRFDKKPQ